MASLIRVPPSLPRRPTSPALMAVQHAVGPSLDWNTSSAMSARIPRKSPSSAPSAHAVSLVETFFSDISRNYT